MVAGYGGGSECRLLLVLVGRCLTSPARSDWVRIATAAVKSSKLGDPAVRKAIMEGKQPLDTSDTMIALARRLTFGEVKGWTENGKPVPPFTNLAGAFEHATGREPYALPQSWLDAKPKLDPLTRLNFLTTNDIIGGNSGSPVINKDGQVVGLIFDGNIHSLGGNYGFDENLNRAVAVHTGAILEALEKIYGAQRVLSEIKAQ